MESMERNAADLQVDLLFALRKGKGPRALELLEQIEKTEPSAPRWPQRRGDLLRRLDRPAEAIGAYELAMSLYTAQGFLARAAALAKVIQTMDPSRTDVLERVEPEAARKLHREQRPAAPSAAEDASDSQRRSLADVAIPLEPAADAASDEVRFADVSTARHTAVEIDVAEVEFLEDSPAARPPDDDGIETRRSPEELARFASTPLFAEISREALAEMLAGSKVLELEAGDPIMRAGDPADALFIIASGSVEVRIPNVRDAVALGEGEVVGEACLLEGAGRSADVVARSKGQVLRIPKDILDRLVARSPKVGDVLLDLLTRRVVLNLIRTSPLFAAFDDATKIAVCKLFEVRRALAGTSLTQAGKRSDGLYIPLVGKVEAIEHSVVRPIRLGEPFGEHALMSRAAASVSVSARTDTLLLRLPATRFNELAALYPAVLEHLAELSSEDLAS